MNCLKNLKTSRLEEGLLQVVNCSLKPFNRIVKMTKTIVTTLTQNPANVAGCVVVVYGKGPLALFWRFATNTATATLRSQEQFILFNANSIKAFVVIIQPPTPTLWRLALLTVLCPVTLLAPSFPTFTASGIIAVKFLFVLGLFANCANLVTRFVTLTTLEGWALYISASHARRITGLAGASLGRKVSLWFNKFTKCATLGFHSRIVRYDMGGGK